jgi:hypothetical protein
MKQIDQYTAVNLEDSGTYGMKLIEGWEGREGDFRPNFCKREFKKGSGEKTAPVSVKLGDKAKAIEVALWMLKELTGREYMPALDQQKDIPESIVDDIPF